MKCVRRSYERKRSGRSFGLTLLSVTVLFGLVGNAAAQAPAGYGFTTGNAPFGGPLAPIFAGQSVSGSFVYDRESPATGVTTAGPSPGSTIYGGNITDLAGSIAGNMFSDPGGLTVVGDDKFLLFGGTDILVLAAEPAIGAAPPTFYDFTGFDIAGFTLINARLFWIEGQLGIGEFLSNASLPAVLPDFPGRLALDFVPTGSSGPVSSVFFDLLQLSPLPQTVTIDIKPGKTPNSINPASMQHIAVAVLTTETFDATQVDPLTVAFGPNGASESHGRSHIKDFDEDGDADLILHFSTPMTGIQCGDTEATLTGETFDGQPITGSDAISTVPCPQPESVTYDFTQTFGNIAVSGTLIFTGSVSDSITVEDLNTLAKWNLSFSTIVPDPVFPLEPFALSDSDSSWATELIPGTSVQIDATAANLVFDLTTPFGTNAALVLMSDGPDFRQFRFGQVNQPGFVGSQIGIQGVDIAAEFSPLPFDEPLAFPAVSTGLDP
ncbi:MAG: hypothetical protein OEQ14_17730 [Gammaproteobacteria bacterium]|nr:hypothetical protein [Gammaproteobacteria bacterium]